MRIHSLFSLLPSLTSLVFASSRNCLTQSRVDYFIEAWNNITGKRENWEFLMQDITTENFTIVSDSLAYLIQEPLNTSVARSRDEYFRRFVAPSPGVQGEFKTLFLSHTCDSITWYREWAIGEYPIREMAVFLVDIEEFGKIYKSLYEWNSGVVVHALCEHGADMCAGRKMESMAKRVEVGNEGVVFERRDCGDEGKAEEGRDEL
ncbi:hypothetical protein AC579_1189 [Pseudocercospora musae]|uniref:NTF2-like domain-containing protein n=1 Tax=Pseudocercospora musae TaxID=113226 RepID=A0A139I6Z1_9PEZI|nr:hypothetical protein AC579_1189 [Pseudocercospora musae]KXT10376.1 hypothetical protein AC579_1189 [Pseudocercospora musae]